MTKNKIDRLKPFLIVLSILATLKMFISAVGLDEEYQVVMSYRNATGGRLFLDMWEPHQSSAFLCTFLMKPYLKFFGTTGVVIYLRVWGALIHLGISVYLYKVLQGFVNRDYAWLLALIYYNTIPKQIMLPEFGIMQVWFYTLLSLFLIQYYHTDRKKRYLILAAVSLALTILSYPSCLILYPFVLVCLARLSGKDRWRDMGIFTLVCGICAAGYLGMLLLHTTPSGLMDSLSHILNGDVTHKSSLWDKFQFFLLKALYELALWLGCWLLATAVAKWKKLESGIKDCLIILFSCVVQLFYWIVLNSGYESMHIHLIAITAAGLHVHAKSLRENIHAGSTQGGASAALSRSDVPSGSTQGGASAALSRADACAGSLQGKRPGTEDAALLRYGIWGAVLCLLAVVYLTDISLTESIPHAMPAAFYSAALLILGLEKSQNSIYSKWVWGVLTVWCLTAIFGKAYTLRANADYSNVLQSGGIMKEGPAAGIISNYISAYIYNCDYEDWQEYLRDGDRVLIMADQVNNLGTIQYLFKDVEISHFSIVNGTIYDERLLEYWEMYPEKEPNVIIVDCWYGELMTSPDGWLMQYIENDFGYTQVDNGRYIRIYRK